MLLEEREDREVRGGSVTGNTENDGVADDESGDEGRVALIQRVIERS